MLIRYSLMVLFYSFISLLIFCLPVLQIVKGEVLKFLIITVALPISPSGSINIYFMYLETLMLGVYTFRITTSSW